MRLLWISLGIRGTGQVRLRWIGRQLRAECEVISTDPAASSIEAHRVAVAAEHCCMRCHGCRQRSCTPARSPARAPTPTRSWPRPAGPPGPAG